MTVTPTAALYVPPPTARPIPTTGRARAPDDKSRRRLTVHPVAIRSSADKSRWVLMNTAVGTFERLAGDDRVSSQIPTKSCAKRASGARA